MLLRFVAKLLPKFGPAPDGRGWWVFFDYRRPVDAPYLKRALPQALAAFLADPQPDGVTLRLGRTFELEIKPATITVEHLFMLGGYADFDAGGFVVGEVIRNLNLCIAEKSKKIAVHRSRYAEWWLVLPDHIGPDLRPEERERIRPHVDLCAFDHVVLLHPRTPTDAGASLTSLHPLSMRGLGAGASRIERGRNDPSSAGNQFGDARLRRFNNALLAGRRRHAVADDRAHDLARELRIRLPSAVWRSLLAALEFLDIAFGWPIAAHFQTSRATGQPRFPTEAGAAGHDNDRPVAMLGNGDHVADRVWIIPSRGELSSLIAEGGCLD